MSNLHAQISELLRIFFCVTGHKPRENTDAVEEQEKRNFIYDLYSSSYALKNPLFRNMPSNAAKHPLVKNGNVRPVLLQPLYKEIDERDFGGRASSLNPSLTLTEYYCPHYDYVSL